MHTSKIFIRNKCKHSFQLVNVDAYKRLVTLNSHTLGCRLRRIVAHAQSQRHQAVAPHRRLALALYINDSGARTREHHVRQAGAVWCDDDVSGGEHAHRVVERWQPGVVEKHHLAASLLSEELHSAVYVVEVGETSLCVSFYQHYRSHRAAMATLARI